MTKAKDIINEFTCKECNQPAKVIDYGLKDTVPFVHCKNKRCIVHNVVRRLSTCGEFFNQPTLTD